MHFLQNLFEKRAAEPLHGGGDHLEFNCINNPAKPICTITPNRPEVFKQYNYKFNLVPA